MRFFLRLFGIVAIALSLGFSPLGAQDSSDRVLEAYALGDIKYAEIQETLKAVMSPSGSINYVKGANKVFVYDTPAVHKLVKDILAKSTKPSVNITVDIEFQNMQMIRDRGLKLGVGSLTVKTGPGPQSGVTGTVDITAHDKETVKQQKNSMSLMVSSGRAGELWSTTDVLDTAALKRYGLAPWQAVVRRPGKTVEKGNFPENFVRAVGTHMWIQPTYMPNGLVQVEVFPVVRAETTDGKETFFRVQSVRTVVTVSPGRKMFIGGTNNAMKSFFKDLFEVGATSKTSSDSLSIYLTATVRIMNPANPSAAPPVRPNRDAMWKHFPDN